MSLLCTVHLFSWAAEFTHYECPFEDSFDALRSAHEDLREDKFLDDIYGADNKLDNDVWLKKIVETSKWAFSAKEFRKAVFKQAEVDYKL